MRVPEIVLGDGGGNSATVAPERGGWLLGYARQLPRRGPIDVLHAPPGCLSDYPDMRAGCHLMFPVAGQCQAASRSDHYLWEGTVRPLPVHGFAMRQPWAVDEVTATSVWLSLASSDATRGAYPFEFRLGLSYALANGALRSVFEVENVGDRPMPFSAGFHPYIRMPLTAAGRRDRCLVRLPACREYFMRPGGVEGDRLQAQRVLPVVAPAAPARHFADLERLQADLIDELGGLRVGLSASLDSSFRCLTAWSPQADAPFYCVEPRTALQDAFSHAAQGQLTVLEPGAAFSAGMTLDLRDDGT